MPSVKFTVDELVRLSGVKDMDVEEIIGTIKMMGADLGGIEDGTIDMEFFPDRPDLFSVEGVARALRQYVSGEVSYHPIVPDDIEMSVSDSVKDVRPYVVGGVVRGATLDDDAVQSLMSLQEKLHATVGRNRAKVAIGVHDLSKVTPPFRYTAVEPDGLRFVPLGMDGEMTPAEILERHEKGIGYAHILEGKALYPVILDANDEVLSFPPVINGTLTTVTTETTDLFIDCTGTSFDAIRTCLDIVSTSLAEHGGTIGSVTLPPEEGAHWPGEPIVTPVVEGEPMRVGHDHIVSLIGADLTHDEVLTSLAKMGLKAEYDGDDVVVTPPSFRSDILHPVDIIEDVAIGYGYDNIPMSLPRTATLGSEFSRNKVVRALRSAMVGLGFQEIVTLHLRGPEEEFEKIRRPRTDVPTISNPIGVETSILRASLLPSMLRMLSDNRHRPLPQMVFEIGQTFQGDRQRTVAGWAVIDASAGYTRAKSNMEAIMRNLASPFEIRPAEDPAFLEGRQAGLLKEGSVIGGYGELHPEVLENFELGYPTIAGEFYLDEFY